VIIDAEAETARAVRRTGVEPLTDALVVDDVIPGWRMPFSEVFD
jgi:hypothetical protein